jgi:hypothetical protein
MVFEKTLEKISDKSVKQFRFDGEDLPIGLRKALIFMLYKAFPFLVNVAFFSGTFVAMLIMQKKFGFERVVIFVFAVYLYSRFAGLTGEKK